MKYDIKNERGHYVLYVNGRFYGSYDSISEIDAEIESFSKNAEKASAQFALKEGRR